MKNYTIVKPEHYTKEHNQYVNKFIDSAKLLSSQTNLMYTIKDVNSVYIIGTDSSALKLGWKSGTDFTGNTTADLPCASVANAAPVIIQQEQKLISTLDINKSIDALYIFEYTDGLKARVVTKKIFYHSLSASILGVTATAANIELRDFINIIPSYLLRFGTIAPLERVKQFKTAGNVALTPYEHELCFLFLLGWSFQQIANFMNIFRPINTYRTGDTIIKKKNYICEKLSLSTTNRNSLCEYLFSLGMHNKMPESFYLRMIGVKLLC